MSKQQLLLVYDRQCPACEFYCRRVAVSPRAGELVRVDARYPSEVMQQVSAAGLDIDAGIVLKLDGRLYYAAAAINRLALLSSRRGGFNRLNYWLFGHPTRAKILYPILRAARNLLLKMLRRTKINNLHKPGNARF